MFTAAVSLIALAASALLGRRELLRRKASGGDRSGLGWGVTFCIMQLMTAALGLLGMAPDDIISPIVLNATLTACAWASFARDLTWSWVTGFIERGALAAARTFKPDCAACDKYESCGHRITKPEDLTITGRLGVLLGKLGGHISEFLHRPLAVRVILLLAAGLFAMLALEILQPRPHLVLPAVHPARVVPHQRRHGRPLPSVPASRLRPRGDRVPLLGHRHGAVLRHHVQVHAHPAGRPLRSGHRGSREWRLHLHLQRVRPLWHGTSRRLHAPLLHRLRVPRAAQGAHAQAAHSST